MNKLWAPWRIKYIKSTGPDKKCIFCGAVNSTHKKNVIFKTKHSVVMLNIFPYNNGHLLVSPIKHVGDFTQLNDEQAVDLFRSLSKTKKLLDMILKPDGFNIGINISKSAGAGITGHLHIHIVPRWVGDTNFMPVVYNTKIISQSLSELHRQLKNAQTKTN